MDYLQLRECMVNEQLIPRGISNPRVLGAFRKVPREEFVPPFAKSSAYIDFPLSIGEGQTISQPYTVALMTELLQLEPHDKVLEIGTGSGYQAAILAELVDKVFSIERVLELAEFAQDNLARSGYKNVEIRVGDGSQGWPEEAPFDGAIITAAAPQIPEPLLDQLAEGGRLVAPVGDQLFQEMVRVTKRGEGFKKETFGAFRFVPLISEE